mmetsp:Transcript_19359/g.74342  ORF Transcript_19359/g.74342 Transcript_19359/m.74342 type:complete len:244 (+) Transcript_19359:3440-4171(+)
MVGNVENPRSRLTEVLVVSVVPPCVLLEVAQDHVIAGDALYWHDEEVLEALAVALWCLEALKKQLELFVVLSYSQEPHSSLIGRDILCVRLEVRRHAHEDVAQLARVCPVVLDAVRDLLEKVIVVRHDHLHRREKSGQLQGKLLPQYVCVRLQRHQVARRQDLQLANVALLSFKELRGNIDPRGMTFTPLGGRPQSKRRADGPLDHERRCLLAILALRALAGGAAARAGWQRWRVRCGDAVAW